MPSSLARVLVLSLELCTVHLQRTSELEQVLCFLIFADGCAASLVTAEPEGIAIDGFSSVVLSGTSDQITWHIGPLGFDMVLSGKVPGTIYRGLRSEITTVLGGRQPRDYALWAVHPGGRSILDAVQASFRLDGEQLRPSRDVLRRYGNMSSATIMFVLKEMLAGGAGSGPGCALAFGPGLSAESMMFRIGDPA